MSGKIKVREYTVFNGNEGWEKDGKIFRLACAPIMAEAPNGDLICTWLTGSDHEPADDNCAVTIRSSDGGRTWRDIDFILPPADENGSAWILRNEDKLVALCARWPKADNYTVWHFFRMESNDNGKSWTGNTPFDLLSGEGKSASFGQLIRTSWGENIICGSTFTKREQMPTVGRERFAAARSEEEALAMPPRTDKERPIHKFGSHLHGVAAFKTDDTLSSFEYLGGVANRPSGLLEPTIIELKDEKLVMLIRAEWDGWLWRSESLDRGRTWSKAYRTDIPNPGTLPHMIRLPDGRIVLFHNAMGGETGRTYQVRERRCLSVWVSRDELESFYIKENIFEDGGYYSYPFGMVRSDGSLVMAYDFNRREIKFCELEIME
ncbi:MAG: exo-alpha-sialidase [Clostridia bacterium]|nr:exo-alpha-sialidase [Clostridia bacterium]